MPISRSWWLTGASSATTSRPRSRTAWSTRCCRCFRDSERPVPDEMFVLGEWETPLYSSVRRFRWHEGGTLELELHALIKYVAMPHDPPAVTVRLTETESGRRRRAAGANRRPTPASPASPAMRWHNYDQGSLTVVVDATELGVPLDARRAGHLAARGRDDRRRRDQERAGRPSRPDRLPRGGRAPGRLRPAGDRAGRGRSSHPERGHAPSVTAAGRRPRVGVRAGSSRCLPRRRPTRLVASRNGRRGLGPPQPARATGAIASPSSCRPMRSPRPTPATACGACAW